MTSKVTKTIVYKLLLVISIFLYSCDEASPPSFKTDELKFAEEFNVDWENCEFIDDSGEDWSEN